MATGLRKRFAVFKKPLSSSPVSDLCVLHEEDERDDDHVVDVLKMKSDGDGKEEHGAFGESGGMMSRSFSSSSDHSSGSGEDDSEQEFESVQEPKDVGPVGKDSHSNGSVKPAQDNSRSSTLASKANTPQNSTPPRAPSTSPPRSMPTRRGTSTLSPVLRRRDSSSSSSSGSWLSGLDLSIIVALVSPIGNILTGSDHIKNILLLLFLIYYLHQLVEVPWTLYRMSISSGDSFSPIGDTDPLKRSAYSELHRLELFYLTLTVLSPFLGATLLKYIATAISGSPGTLSWFSTSLFVLATGIRPWSHLAERMKNRSNALKAIVEDTDESRDVLEDPKVEIDKSILELRGKFDVVDKRLADLGASSAREWDDLADAIDAIELTLRKYQNETNKKAQEWDARLGVLETYVLDLHARDRRTKIHENETYLRGAKLRDAFWNLLALPWTLTALMWDFSGRVVRGAVGEFELGLTSRGGVRNGKERLRSPTSPQQTKFRPRKLETIVEEEAELQDHEPDNAAEASQSFNGMCVGSDSSQTVVAELAGDTDVKQQYSSVSDLVFALTMRLFGIAFAPLFFFVRVVLAVVELPRSVFRALVPGH